MSGARLVLALAGGLFVACSGASPPPPRPAVLRAAAAKCHEVGARGDPIVADLTDEQRAGLDAAMKRGVAVVAYRCGALRVLEGCSAAGDYAFAGIRAEDRLVQLESPDEVQANLPSSGARLAVDLAPSLVGGASFDVGLVQAGKWTTTRSRVHRAELEGAGCDEATHFVIGTTVGAAAMKMASGAGDASGVFEAAGGGRARADACRGGGEGRAAGPSPLELDSPAPGCAAPLVLHLDKIGAGPPPDPPEHLMDLVLPISLQPAAPACPQDLVSRAGKCASPAAAIGHLCDPKDTRACRAQCEAGHFGSCNNLAAGLCPADEPLIHGCKGRALQEAFELTVRACEGGVPEACAGLAALPMEDEPDEEEGEDPPSGLRPSRAFELNEQACDAGSALACEIAVGLLLREGSRAEGSSPRRERAALRGCNLGSLPACARALEDTASAERASWVYPRLCFGGELEACVRGGDVILAGAVADTVLDLSPGSRGAAPPPAPPAGDLERAIGLYRHACAGIGDKKHIEGCTRLARIFAQGHGTPKDVALAVSLYQQACDQAEPGEVAGPCLALARLHAKGEGVARDTERAAALYERACSDGGAAGGAACLERGLMLAREDAGKREAGRLFVRGCEQAGLSACRGFADALAEGAEAPKDPEAAILVHEGACEVELATQNALDEPLSCMRAGDLITAVAGKKKDPRAAVAYERAAQFYATTCEHRDLDACFVLAAMLRKGDKVKADPARARALVADAVERLQASCDRGALEDCMMLADRIVRGQVPPKNVQRALAIYEKACKQRNEACNTFAEALRWGKLGKRDYARAAGIYKKACDGGSEYGCGNLAALYEEGKAKPAAGEPGVIALYRSGCDRDHKLSCLRLASMVARGDRVDKDEARAKALLEKVASPTVVARMKGCCEDSPDCCSAAGFACAHGLGTDKDPQRGAELLRKGCDGGDDWGCARLKELPPLSKEAAPPR